MGNDMFNDEQLAHAEIVQKETEDALGWWKDRALKAEAALSALSRARETDGAVREAAERLRLAVRVKESRSWCGHVACDAVRGRAYDLLAALSSPPRPATKENVMAPSMFGAGLLVPTRPMAVTDAPPADAATEAVREAADDVLANETCSCYRHSGPCGRCKMAYDDLSALLSAPAPAPSAKEGRA